MLNRIDIYSLFQDKDNRILLATEEGLFIYDGYDFKLLTNVRLKSQEFFSLIENSKKEIFFFNLNGEIIKLVDDSLELHFQIPDSLVSGLMSITFDNNDNLFVSAKKNLMITPQKELHIIPIPRTVSHALCALKPLYNKIYYSTTRDSLYCYDKGEVKSYSIYPFNGEIYLPVPGGSPYFYKMHECQILKLNGNKFEDLELKTSHIKESNRAGTPYITRNNFIWHRYFKGAYAFNKNGKPLYGGNKIYPDIFTSQFLEDNEGNFWVGTMGNGIMFIKNKDLISYHDHPTLKNNSFTKVVFDKSGNLYLGSIDGKIFQITPEEKIRLIALNKDRKMNVFCYLKQSNSLFFQASERTFLIDLNSKKTTSKFFKNTVTIKDVHENSDSSMIWATAYGIRKQSLERDSSSSINSNNIYNIERGNAILNDEETNEIWWGGVTQLIKIKDSAWTILKYKDSDIIASKIERNKKDIWVSTTNLGILKFNGNNVVFQLNEKNGLLSNNVKKIILKDENLFIAHNKGLQIYNTTQQSFTSISTSDGLLSNRVIDFAIYKDQIVVINFKGVQKFKIKDIFQRRSIPEIKISSISVNDTITPLSKKIFDYNENQLSFSFKVKGYSHLKKVQYAYKLEEIENEWHFLPFEDNKVRYHALPHGKYTFKVKAINGHNTEGNIAEFSFTILPPYWERWWFYLLIGIAISSSIFYAYRNQMARVKLKNEREKELASSKLTALKSQMNPHFIFNALNSIQDLVLKNDVENSYNYITKFSNLVRKFLNYSDQDYIDFESEIELITLYLELEKLRFKENFDFSITMSDIEEVSIPPMLIQPFVENAVKHGLLHKEGEKKVAIDFQLKDALICTIIDNGIGRKRAQEIKDRQKRNYESFSVGATKSRFKILQEHYEMELGIEYEDLYDLETPSGTKVTLYIPFNRKF